MTLLHTVFAILAAGALSGTARAASVYKCTAADGAIAFQATPCTGQSRQHIVELVPAPTGDPVAAPDAGTSRPNAGARHRSRTPRNDKRSRVAAESTAGSYECRVGTTEIFYQHAPCPTTVIAEVESRQAATRDRNRSATRLAPVSSRPIARKEACRRIHAASAGDRAGHARDEDVSTYERNLGRDPCR